MHIDEPLVAAYEPAVQGVQLLLPTAEIKPAGQARHKLCPAAEYWPAKQGKQADALVVPVILLNVPEVQLVKVTPEMQ